MRVTGLRSIGEHEEFCRRLHRSGRDGIRAEEIMSIATDILSLRRDQSSSVSGLLAAIEWECAAEEDIRLLARGYDVMRMADAVLVNVAAHAADQLVEPTTIRRTRRSVPPSRRIRRRSDPGKLHQRWLFA